MKVSLCGPHSFDTSTLVPKPVDVVPGHRPASQQRPDGDAVVVGDRVQPDDHGRQHHRDGQQRRGRRPRQYGDQQAKGEESDGEVRHGRHLDHDGGIGNHPRIIAPAGLELSRRQGRPGGGPDLTVELCEGYRRTLWKPPESPGCS